MPSSLDLPGAGNLDPGQGRVIQRGKEGHEGWPAGGSKGSGRGGRAVEVQPEARRGRRKQGRRMSERSARGA